MNQLQKLKKSIAGSATAFYTLCGIAGAMTLAMFEYFGLVSDTMNFWYKVGLGLGVAIICIAYMRLCRSHPIAVTLLAPIFCLYLFSGSFAGRTTMVAEAEKQAQHIEHKNKTQQELSKQLSQAIELTIDHKTIKSNGELYKAAAKIAGQDSDAAPITIKERRNAAVSTLAEFGIHTNAESVETALSALFTLCLFISVGILSRAGMSRETKILQGDQGVRVPGLSARTTYTDEEILAAIEDDIKKHNYKSYSNPMAQKAIKKFYKSDVGAGKDRVAEIVKQKKAQLEKPNTWKWGIIKGGKK